MQPSPTDITLQVGFIDTPDLTDTLQRSKKRIVGHGSLGTVYHCSGTQRGEVAVKAVTFPHGFPQTEKDVFMRKMKREVGIWRRLDHPNIVSFLGTTRGEDFGSDYDCMVSTWMQHGTLIEYLKQHEVTLSLSSRIRLIKGTVAGLEYLHSKELVHMDFHPGNVMIDDEHNVRLTDFGFYPTPRPEEEQLSYLWTDSIRPGAVMWVAPELQYPYLYPDLETGVTFNSNVYSLGSMILFILSGNFPWKNRGEAEDKLREFRSPPRPMWPANIPDGVWNFLERCWSPRQPRSRPPAKEVLSFSTDKLEQLLQPHPASDINVVLFGALGCGKSSIINLLAEEPIAQVSPDVEPCTRRPRWYQISVDERQFRLWDTMGFCLAHGGDTSHLLPYEQAHTLLRNLSEGVGLILLCARSDGIFTSLGSLYWLLNSFFYGGRAPIAFVATHLDTLDEEWWERNQATITEKTGIPVQSIPHACVTTVEPGCTQSQQALKALLGKFATAVPPISLCLDLSSHTTASLDLTAHCKLSLPDATALVEKFNKSLHLFNVVFFGETGVGKSSVINLVIGHSIAQVGSGPDTCTLGPRAYRVNTGIQQFQIWDTVGFARASTGDDNLDSRAAMNAAQLIRDLAREGGIDLIVFMIKSRVPGQLTSSELSCYRLFEEVLCGGRVPVAIVVTQLESHGPMERWWDVNGKGLVKSIGGIVLGHACINLHPDGVQLDKKLTESRLSVQAMLEDCVSPHSASARIEEIKHCLKTAGRRVAHRNRMTVDYLQDRCGLAREQAERLISLYYSNEGPDTVY